MWSLACREHQAGIGEQQPKSANELRHMPVGHVSQGLELAGAWPQPRQRDGQRGFPAGPEQVLSVSRQANGCGSAVAASAGALDRAEVELRRYLQSRVKSPFTRKAQKLLANVQLMQLQASALPPR